MLQGVERAVVAALSVPALLDNCRPQTLDGSKFVPVMNPQLGDNKYIKFVMCHKNVSGIGLIETVVSPIPPYSKILPIQQHC